MFGLGICDCLLEVGGGMVELADFAAVHGLAG